MAYDLFISYTKADAEFAERLVKRIESEEHCGRLFRCFYAPWDIRPGENILLKIEQAERTSRFVGLIMSPDWVKSDWTTLERVIPVFEDPAGLKARIIPMLRRNCEIPPSIRILNWLDFTHEANFDRETRRLVARLGAEPMKPSLHGRGSAISRPDSMTAVVQDEILASNLFGVTQLPRFVYSAAAEVGSRDEVFAKLGEGVSIPPFALRGGEGRVYSFSALENNQTRLGELLSEKSTQRHLTEDFVAHRGDVVIELLNRSMTAHMRDLGMTYDWRSKKTFFQLENYEDALRTIKWRVDGREFTRKLVVKAKNGEYFAHRSCKATFQNLVGSIYLKIRPGWHFTVDGLTKAVTTSRMTSLSTRWMNIERNHTLLDNLRFWAQILSRDSEKISLDVAGDESAEISSTPAFSGIDHGIEEDYRERLWYEDEPDTDEADRALSEAEAARSIEATEGEESDD